MAGGGFRTLAEWMGLSSIQMTKRCAHLAPQHNRAAVDRVVSVSMSNRSAKEVGESVQRKTEVVTKSVTNRKRVSRSESGNQNNSIKIN
jgi:hypothetical protein